MTYNKCDPGPGSHATYACEGVGGTSGITNYLNHSYFVGIFTAGRDGKDGRGPIVQSFPLFSIEFGGVL